MKWKTELNSNKEALFTWEFSAHLHEIVALIYLLAYLLLNLIVFARSFGPERKSVEEQA